MILELKLLLLLTARKLEEVIHSVVSRYIVKHILSDMKELPMWKMLSWTYIRNLTLTQLAGLAVIASFTIITFPLGVWISSFSANKYYPLSAVFSHLIAIVLIPLNLFAFNKVVNEMKFTQTTFLGLLIIEVAMILGAIGWFLIYKGNL